MKIIEISDKQIREMLKSATAAKANTYPESGSYAVAVLTKSGFVYQGVSYRSDTYTLTMHAEATALAHAAIHGEKEIVAITGPNCHACKQLLWEHSLKSGIDIQVIIGDKDDYTLIPISQQMPFPWPDKDGKH